MIDAIDREIIGHLQADGRMPYSQLGKLIGLSDAAARQRVNRLVSSGVMDIVAVTDPAQLGLGIQAMLGLTIDGDVRKVAVDVGQIDEAVYVVMTAGRYDLLVEVVGGETDDFVELLTRLRAIDGVVAVEPFTYLGITKQTYDWGVG